MLFGLCAIDLERLGSARAWGYDYVEIGSANVAPLEPDGAWHPRRRQLEDTGARITHMATFIPASVRVVGPDVDWARVRAYLETCVGRAAEVGVRTFTLGSSGSRNVPPGWAYSHAFAQLERATHTIADVLAPHGARCVIEPLNSRESNIVNYVTDGAMLAQSIGRPQIRALCDYYHMALQSEPLAHVAEASPWLAHTHTAGPARSFPRPDDGWDHPAYAAALRDAGYDQTLSLECSRVPDGTIFGDAARDGVAYYRSLWTR
jgi:sugar phosphate isomerase/epimerase